MMYWHPEQEANGNLPCHLDLEEAVTKLVHVVKFGPDQSNCSTSFLRCHSSCTLVLRSSSSSSSQPDFVVSVEKHEVFLRIF